MMYVVVFLTGVRLSWNQVANDFVVIMEQAQFQADVQNDRGQA